MDKEITCLSKNFGLLVAIGCCAGGSLLAAFDAPVYVRALKRNQIEDQIVPKTNSGD